MKLLIVAITLSVCLPDLALAQKKDEVNFSNPFQVDSSAYFLIPRLVDDNNRDVYGKGKGILPWGSYSEIFFFNSTTGSTKKLFNQQPVLIQPFFPQRNVYDRDKGAEYPANILPRHILYIARTENFNGDNGLDTEDPQYLYISDKTGNNLRLISPKGLSVVSWTVSKDKKMILAKLLNDKNANKKFGAGDDEVYYRIDLDDDISKIQYSPIPL